MERRVRILSIFALAGGFLLAGCPVQNPDAYEPNETIADSYDLGTVAEVPSESSWGATLSPAGDHDFYGFTAPDPSTIGFPSDPEHFTLTVGMVPPQAPDARNYDLYLYDDAGSALDSSTNADSAEETITFTWDGTVGMNDARIFRIEVRSVGGDFSGALYTLYASLGETSP